MTICIGAICDSGESVVMASDRMITAGALSIEFEHPTVKMDKLTDNSIIATAGDALLHTDLLAQAGSEIEHKRLTIDQLCESIKKCYVGLRNRDILEGILIPQGFNSFDEFQQKQRMILPEIAMSLQTEIKDFELGFDILLGGIDNSGGHIHTITNPGFSRSFDVLGYHAIGIGAPHALTNIIANSYSSTLNLKTTLLIIYEAKKMAEKAPGVGTTYTDMAIITKGESKNLDPSVIEEIDKVYESYTGSRANQKHLKDAIKEIRIG